MKHPRRVLVEGARPASAENGLPFTNDLGLNKEIAERRMQRVRRRRGEHDLGITRDSIVLRVREQLVMRTRRSSMSSSGDTTISVCVSISVIAAAKFRPTL